MFAVVVFCRYPTRSTTSYLCWKTIRRWTNFVWLQYPKRYEVFVLFFTFLCIFL